MSRVTAMLTAALLCTACGRRPLEPRDPDPGRFHFTIQSYNILDSNVADPSTLDALGRANADIVALQEITPEWQTAIEARYGSSYS